MNLPIATAMQGIATFVSMMLGRPVKVVWGQSAKCDSNGVISLPRPKTGSTEEIALLTRRAVHEAGHANKTDFSCFQGLSVSEATILNCLEDPRIEREQIAEFPGAKVVLNRGTEAVMQSILQDIQMGGEQASPERLLTLSLLIRGYCQIAPHKGMVDNAPAILQQCDQSLGPKITSLIENAVKSLEPAKSTADVAVVAKSLAASIRNLQLDESHSEDDSGDQTEDSTDGESGAGGADDNQPDDSHNNSNSVDEQSGESDGQSGGAADTEDSPGSEDSNSAVSDKSSKPNESQDQPNSTPDDGGAGSKGAEPPDCEVDTPTGDEASDAGNSSSSNDGDVSNGMPEPTEQSSNGNQSDEAESPNGDFEQQQDSCASPQSGTSGQASASGQKLDLDAIASEDIGSLLQKAYEKQFGTEDIDTDVAGREQRSDADETESQQALVDAAMAEMSDDADESFVSALQAIQPLLDSEGTDDQSASVSDSENDSEEETQPLTSETFGVAGGSSAPSGPAQILADARISAVVSRLARVLLSGLQDRRRVQNKFASSGTRIAANRVWRLKSLGDTDVFRIRKTTSGIDAAVKILVDRSGSMNSDITSAMESALALSQALERVSKVRASIDLFPHSIYDGCLAPTHDLGVECFQRFGQSARQVERKCESVTAGGGTPLKEALRDCLPDLFGQRCEKRYLILITDGMPDGGLTMQLRSQLSAAAAGGVEIIGIGLGSKCKIETIVANSLAITCIDELPKALEKLLSGLLADKMAA